jgi:phage head maturation protease
MAEETQDLVAAAGATPPERPRAPIELRTATVDDLNLAQRIATVIVTPYEQETVVAWRGEAWKESFERTAWNGIEGRPNRVRANRAHDRRLTCGKAVKFFPNRQEGLVAEVRCSQTPLGDETLELLRDGCLSVSAGFGALPDGQIIDRRAKTRRITTAYLDHIAFVEDPAYPGAEVLEVRENELVLPDEPPLPEPVRFRTSDFMNDPIYLNSLKYLNKG